MRRTFNEEEKKLTNLTDGSGQSKLDLTNLAGGSGWVKEDLTNLTAWSGQSKWTWNIKGSGSNYCLQTAQKQRHSLKRMVGSCADQKAGKYNFQQSINIFPGTRLI